jgi:hypothetical protein
MKHAKTSSYTKWFYLNIEEPDIVVKMENVFPKNLRWFKHRSLKIFCNKFEIFQFFHNFL